jgi:hypothetical protein
MTKLDAIRMLNTLPLSPAIKLFALAAISKMPEPEIDRIFGQAQTIVSDVKAGNLDLAKSSLLALGVPENVSTLLFEQLKLRSSDGDQRPGE